MIKIPPQHSGAGFGDGFNEILVMIPEELGLMKESSHHIPSQFEFGIITPYSISI